MYARTCTAILDQGNSGAWHGTSPSATAMTIASANDAGFLLPWTAKEGRTYTNLYSSDW